jgi:hypothetical protein
MRFLTNLLKDRRTFLREPELKSFTGEDFKTANQRGASIDDRTISPFHTYGDVSVNYHFQDMVNGRRGATLYWNMPSQATLYHDPDHPWYDGIRHCVQFVKQQEGYTFMRVIPTISEAALSLTSWIAENLTVVVFMLIVVFSLSGMFSASNALTDLRRQESASAQVQWQKAQQAQLEAQKQALTIEFLKSSLTQAQQENRELTEEIKQIKQSQEKFKDWVMSQVIDTEAEPNKSKRRKVKPRKSNERAPELNRGEVPVLGGGENMHERVF